MSKSRSSPPPPGLSAADAARLDTQLPEIAAALREKPLRTDGQGWRVGSSLQLSPSGWWRDHKLGVSGFGAVALIMHFRNCALAEAVAWALTWLGMHLDPGPCTGDPDADTTHDEAEATARTELLKVLYASRLSVASTDAAVFIASRGFNLAELRPEIVERMGFLPNFRGNEGAIVYPYTDEAGEIVGLHFVHIQPGGAKSQIEPIRSTRKGPADWRRDRRGLLRFDFGDGPEMVVAEGLENGLAAVLAGCPRVVCAGYVSAFGLGRLPDNVDAIVLAHDGDDPQVKPAAVQSYHRGIARYLGQRLSVRMTAPPLGCDPNETLQREGVEGLRTLLSGARFDLGRFDATAFLKEIFSLNESAYDHARKPAAKLLHLDKVKTLDDERRATRKRWAEGGDGEDVPIVPDEHLPWPDPVPDIGPVLDEALTEISRYVVALKHRLATTVLWSAQTHLLPREELGIDVAPRLAIQSPIKGSGKTTLLEGVYNMVPRPEIAGAISASAVFRIIDQMHPTLLIDEADNVIYQGGNPELLSILNSGHRRKSAYVIKSVPTPEGGFVAVKFNTFTGIAYAGIKHLPETQQDRAIVVPLERAMRGEKREHLVNGRSQVLIDCRRKMARWAADLQELPNIQLPPWLYNRIGDNWRTLFIIAEMAGGQWPSLVLQAAREAVAEEDTALLVQLLESLWQVFAAKKVTRMHTDHIIRLLLNEGEAPWKEANNGREINAYWLREMLKHVLPRPTDATKRKAFNASRRWREGTAPPQQSYTKARPG